MTERNKVTFSCSTDLSLAWSDATEGQLKSDVFQAEMGITYGKHLVDPGRGEGKYNVSTTVCLSDYHLQKFQERAANWPSQAALCRAIIQHYVSRVSKNPVAPKPVAPKPTRVKSGKINRSDRVKTTRSQAQQVKATHQMPGLVRGSLAMVSEKLDKLATKWGVSRDMAVLIAIDKASADE